MRRMKNKVLSVVAAGTLLLGAVPSIASADTPKVQSIPQGTGPAVLQNANYFGDLDPDTSITVDIVMKVHNKDALKHFINETVSPESHHYRKYLSTHQFKAKYGARPNQINTVTHYLRQFGISSKVYDDNLVITATGTVSQFNKAFSVDIKKAKFKGKHFHATKKQPKAPKNVAENILAILGLSDYSNFKSLAVKRPVEIKQKDNSPEGPLSLDPKDLIKRYNVQPLYDKGAKGQGQTIGIVTLANFNPEDAYSFWKEEGIKVKPDRIKVTNVDGGSNWDGYEETSLDVEQSGALAPMSDINVYVGPNTDPGFVDAYAQAINENKAKQISVSWGLSETAIIDSVNQKVESPEYAEVFNQLYMQAAAQGISMFAASGDAAAYDATRTPGTYQLSVDNPADSPYVTAAGGTTLPWHTTTKTGVKVSVDDERAWGWDYLYKYFDSLGYNNPQGWANKYFSGGGGGFSAFFDTPDYQKGVPGVNSYTAVKQWEPSSDYTSVQRVTPELVKGTGKGRNMPDLSMDADPYTGYKVYLSDPGKQGSNSQWAVYGGTSFVSPQLNGLTALINSADHTQVGFWNPQIYHFAKGKNSPFKPLNTTGSTNDNLFYTGTKGTVYNQATGLGVPDVASLADHFAHQWVKPGPKRPGPDGHDHH
ncbi:S53 family peptidase [Scopulibacillus cellulosilyticus]|uniref:Protease pro-enzyme activation domain-containing protein n=1 Tax=Scopulibacillus cellulosilyticus TaxID=2665665 RepID=A0ABW2PVG0_9BACL